jgi:hypothetical protein
MELLKPCFKCGQPPVAGPAAVGVVEQLWVIACPNCGETTEGFTTIEAAAAFWNDRRDHAPALEAPSSDEGDDEPPIGDGVGESLLPLTA